MNFLAELTLKAAEQNAAANKNIWDRPEFERNVSVQPDVLRHLHRKVVAVTVHASSTAMGQNINNSIRIAHFRIFLVLEASDTSSTTVQSIELNSRGFYGTETRLFIQFCPYAHSRTKTFLGYTPIEVVAQFTVKDAIEAILKLNRHKYTLDEHTGSGCRYWTHTIIGDFIGYSWLHRSSSTVVDNLAQTIRVQSPAIFMPEPAPRGRWQ